MVLIFRTKSFQTLQELAQICFSFSESFITSFLLTVCTYHPQINCSSLLNGKMNYICHCSWLKLSPEKPNFSWFHQHHPSWTWFSCNLWAHFTVQQFKIIKKKAYKCFRGYSTLSDYKYPLKVSTYWCTASNYELEAIKQPAVTLPLISTPAHSHHY